MRREEKMREDKTREGMAKNQNQKADGEKPMAGKRSEARGQGEVKHNTMTKEAKGSSAKGEGASEKMVKTARRKS